MFLFSAAWGLVSITKVNPHIEGMVVNACQVSTREARQEGCDFKVILD